jgi:glutaminase
LEESAKLATVLERLGDRLAAYDDWGQPAQYIPSLARIPARQFAVAACLRSGQTVTAGSPEKRFSIQSISKVFTLCLAMGRHGEQLWSWVGREPSGTSFDSLSILEAHGGKPRNPFDNAGAIVTTASLLSGREPKAALTELLDFVRYLADDEGIYIDNEVAQSEAKTGFTNVALANLMRAKGTILEPPELVLGTYFHQCAIEMSASQLAQAGRALAFLPLAPSAISVSQRRRVNALMVTCGLYDQSGDFAFQVGLPAKSGVGGGLLLLVPNQASIAIWAPGLNAKGNSKVGIRIAAHIAEEMNWSLYS